MKLIKYAVLFLVVLLLLLFFGKTFLLRGIGNYLIDESTPEKSDVIFVLGGNTFDRCNEAFDLLNNGFSDKIICTGKNVPTILEVFNLKYSEAETGVIHLKSLGVNDKSVRALNIGTSTKEESEAIIKLCTDSNYNRVIVVTDKFHTHRVKNVFLPLFEAENSELLIVGASSSLFDESVWWKSEEGLIMVNNEYMKLLYYFITY